MKKLITLLLLIACLSSVGQVVTTKIVKVANNTTLFNENMVKDIEILDIANKRIYQTLKAIPANKSISTCIIDVDLKELQSNVVKAKNGLYIVSNDLRDTIKLGGTLTEPTTISQNGRTFKILDAGHGSVFGSSGIAYTKIDTASFGDSTLITKLYAKKYKLKNDSVLPSGYATNYKVDEFFVPYRNAHSDVDLGAKNITSTQQNLPINVGVVVMPTHVKNGDGTITLGSNGTYNFAKSADGSTGIAQKVVVLGTTITLTDNAVNFVYVDYNGGSPVYATSLDNMIFKDDFTKVPVIRATREGAAVHFEEYDLYGLLLANKLMVKDVYLNGGRRLSGLILSTAATRISTISAGSSVFAVQYYDNMHANIAGTSGSLYEYYLSGGVWNRSLVTSYDAIYYSDGTNRQLLGNNKWVAKYYFRDIGDDNEAYYVHGHEYNNKSDAVNELIPAVPPIMAAHSVYVGKIAIEKNALNGTAYPRVWEGAVQNEGTSDHSDLSAESLVWGNSGHTGTVNNLASFDGTGVASYTPNNSTNWNTAYTHSQNDTDLSPANEIQTLSTNGSAGNISISSGNTITLNVNDHTNRTALDNVSGVNTGDNATNTTSNSYADGKVQDTIVDGVTTIAPSQNAVYDALANKVPKVTSTDNAIARFDGTGGSIQNSGAYLFDSGNFYVGSNTENSYSRMLIYGGANGANLDVRGEAGTFTDQATVEVTGNDYDTTTRSAYLQYKGSTHTGTTLGYSNANLSQLVMNGDNNLIYSSLAKPIIFGTNNQRSGMLDIDGKLVLDNLASASSSIVIASTAGKLNKATFSTIGNSGAATFSLDNLNIPNYTLEGLGGQPQLNGTGFVKASGTTISYDNSTYEPAFSKNTAFNKNFGTTSGTVLEGRTFGTAANNNTGDFLSSAYTVYTNGDVNQIYKLGFYTLFNSPNAPMSSDMGLINIPSWGAQNSNDRYNFQIAAQLGNPKFYMRSTDVSGAGSWNEIYHSGNSNTSSVSWNASQFQLTSTPLLLDWLKSGSAPASGNIVVGNGTTSNPSGVSVNQAIGGNALTSGYLPYWDGSKLANSIIQNIGENVILKNTLRVRHIEGKEWDDFSTSGNLYLNYSNSDHNTFIQPQGGKAIVGAGGELVANSIFQVNGNSWFGGTIGVSGNAIIRNVFSIESEISGRSGIYISNTGDVNSFGYTDIQGFYSGVGYSSSIIMQRQSGNLGIGYFNSNSEISSKLTVNGDCRIYNLSGTGTRLVSATSDGTLSNITNGTEGQVLKIVSGVPQFNDESGGIADAPTDGLYYLRKDNAWEQTNAVTRSFSAYTLTLPSSRIIDELSGAMRIRNASFTNASFNSDGTTTFLYNITGVTASFSGMITADNFKLGSDRRIKQGIKPIKNIDFADKIKFVSYFMKSDTTRMRYGVIAQDVEKINPSFVYTDDKGMKSVDYIGILVSKIEYLQQKVNELESDMKNVKRKIKQHEK